MRVWCVCCVWFGAGVCTVGTVVPCACAMGCVCSEFGVCSIYLLQACGTCVVRGFCVAHAWCMLFRCTVCVVIVWYMRLCVWHRCGVCGACVFCVFCL